MVDESELTPSARYQLEWLDAKFKVQLEATACDTYTEFRRKRMITYAKELMDIVRHVPSVCYSSLPSGKRKDLVKVMRMMGLSAVTGRRQGLMACLDARRIAAELKPEYDVIEDEVRLECLMAWKLHHAKHEMQREMIGLKDLMRKTSKAEAAQANDSDAQAKAKAEEVFKLIQVGWKIQDGETPDLEDYPSDAPFHGFKPESEWGRLYTEVIRHLAVCNKLLENTTRPPWPDDLKMARLQLRQVREYLKQVDALPSPEGEEREAVERIIKQLGSVEELEARLDKFEQDQALKSGVRVGRAATPAKPVRSFTPAREQCVLNDEVEPVADAADKTIAPERDATEELFLLNIVRANKVVSEEEVEEEYIVIGGPEDLARLERLEQGSD